MSPRSKSSASRPPKNIKVDDILNRLDVDWTSQAALP